MKASAWWMLALVFGSAPLHGQVSSFDGYNRAWQAVGQMRPDEAIPLLKDIIAEDRLFWRAYATLVEAYEQANHLDDAVTYFRSLLADDGTDDGRIALAHYGVGLVALRKQEPARASQEFKTCLEHMPSAHACADQLVTSMFPRNTGEAADHFKRLVYRNPASATFYYGLSRAYESQQKGPRLEVIHIKEAALELARTQGDLELQAILFQILADAYMGIDPRKSLDLLVEALKRFKELGDLESELITNVSIAETYAALGHDEQSIRLLQATLDRVRALGHLRLEATTLRACGHVQRERGHLDDALQYYRQYEEIERRRGFMSGRLTALQEISEVQKRQGDYAQAFETLQTHEQLAMDTGNRAHEAWGLRLLGRLHYELGEYSRVLEDWTHEVKLFRDLGGDSYGFIADVATGNIGKVYLSLGDYTRAAEHYHLALRSAREHGDLADEAAWLNELAGLYLQTGDLARAKTSLLSARRLAVQVGHPGLAASTLLKLGEIHMRLGMYPAALESLNEVLTLARSLKNKGLEGAALIALGSCRTKSGDLEEAERYLRGGLALVEHAEIKEGIWPAHKALGDTLARRGEAAEAFEQYRQAIETIESLRVEIPSPELGTGFLQDKMAVYEEALRALWRLHQQSPGSGYDRLAFHYAEQSRARAFLDTLAESKAHVTKGLTDQQVKRHAMLRAAISSANTALRDEESDKNRRALRKAEDEFNDWVLDLRRTSPRYHAFQYPEPVTLAQVQRDVARSDAVMLEYALGEIESFVWVISGKTLAMRRLPRRSLVEVHVRNYRNTIGERPRDAQASGRYVAEAGILYQMLVRPIEPDLASAQRLIIVPDGILHYLPFETLMRPNGRPLVADHTIAYAPSASVLEMLAAPDHRAATAPRELLAYGDPEFSTSSQRPSLVPDAARDVVRSYAGRGVHFPPLPFTRDEVENISADCRAPSCTVYLGRDATEASVKREQLSAYRHIHFATHAVLDEQVPSRSGIVLSLANRGQEDGILQMSEIFDLDLDAELVVLSACQTALGKIVRGEGVVGLTRAFMYAGAPRLVVSLWAINDVATADFMKIFYGKMKQGAAPAAALREAKLDMRRSGVPAYRHPYFWSAFVLVGAL